MFHEKKKDQVILSTSIALSFARTTRDVFRYASSLLHACESRQKREMKETRINRGETANNRMPLSRSPGFFSSRADDDDRIERNARRREARKSEAARKNIIEDEFLPLGARTYRKYDEKKKKKRHKKQREKNRTGI